MYQIMYLGTGIILSVFSFPFNFAYLIRVIITITLYYYLRYIFRNAASDSCMYVISDSGTYNYFLILYQSIYRLDKASAY